MNNLKKAFSEIDMILNLIDSEMKNKVSADFIKFIKMKSYESILINSDRSLFYIIR